MNDKVMVTDENIAGQADLGANEKIDTVETDKSNPSLLDQGLMDALAFQINSMKDFMHKGFDTISNKIGSMEQRVSKTSETVNEIVKQNQEKNSQRDSSSVPHSTNVSFCPPAPSVPDLHVPLPSGYDAPGQNGSSPMNPAYFSRPNQNPLGIQNSTNYNGSQNPTPRLNSQYKTFESEESSMRKTAPAQFAQVHQNSIQ